MVGVHAPYFDNEIVPDLVFKASHNLILFDRSGLSAGAPFYVLGQCTYTSGQPLNSFMQFSNNMYWRTDGRYGTDQGGGSAADVAEY